MVKHRYKYESIIGYKLTTFLGLWKHRLFDILLNRLKYFEGRFEIGMAFSSEIGTIFVDN